jgi:hypothetical protein
VPEPEREPSKTAPARPSKSALTLTGKAKAVTATARKLAVLFYNAMRFGMAYVDPGEDHYEENYKHRVVRQLHRRAKQMGFTLVSENATVGVS